jgi:hypothetical protein
MSAGLAIAAVAALSFCAFAADPVTKDEAVAMVKKAVTAIKAEGAEKAYAEITNPTGPFVDRDLYIVVYGLDGMVLAQAPTNRVWAPIRSTTRMSTATLRQKARRARQAKPELLAVV